jgi:hypothetical protein
VFYVERDEHVDVWRVLHAQRDIPAWMDEPKSKSSEPVPPFDPGAGMSVSLSGCSQSTRPVLTAARNSARCRRVLAGACQLTGLTTA